MKEGDVVMIVRDTVPHVEHRNGHYGMLGIITYINVPNSPTSFEVDSGGEYSDDKWLWERKHLELIEES